MAIIGKTFRDTPKFRHVARRSINWNLPRLKFAFSLGDFFASAGPPSKAVLPGVRSKYGKVVYEFPGHHRHRHVASIRRGEIIVPRGARGEERGRNGNNRESGCPVLGARTALPLGMLGGLCPGICIAAGRVTSWFHRRRHYYADGVWIADARRPGRIRGARCCAKAVRSGWCSSLPMRNRAFGVTPRLPKGSQNQKHRDRGSQAADPVSAGLLCFGR